ncbi:MAG: GyrI-like domain-containing protein [Kofleriaceae bacterium]|nr:GyrI-like domain-containing protein [Kofleriaceae bacterium]MCL4227826.1 GyrI-like domain-containing protein [Myxococcales bacterium]
MDTVPEVIDLSPGLAIAIRSQLPMSELPGFFGNAFGELAACGAEQIAGPPFAIYHAVDSDTIDVEAVMPVRAPVATRGRVHPLELAGGPAVQVKHIGPYEDLGVTHMTIQQWLEDHHARRAGPVREIYLNEPRLPAENITLVIQPIATGATGAAGAA